MSASDYVGNRKYNFSPGPCTLPLALLEEARDEFVDYCGAGMSMIEMSHRGDIFSEVAQEAAGLMKAIYGAPEEFKVLFVQGGATLQFAMVPMNFLHDGQRGAYVHSGAWAKGAIADGAVYGDTYLAWDGTSCNYTRMPSSRELAMQDNTRYLHITGNETIGGVRYAEWPDVGVQLVGDMSSEYLTRELPWERFDLVYGGTQKNLGPSGMAVVLVRESVLEGCNRQLGQYLRYDVHAGSGSMFNTPPVFAIYMFGKMLRWVKGRGGLAGMEQAAEERAGLLYAAIDGSDGFYRSPVERGCRSRMNVVFRLESEEMEERFLMEAERKGLVNLKGHRSVGGCRASVYNAMPMEGAEALVRFMGEFREG